MRRRTKVAAAALALCAAGGALAWRANRPLPDDAGFAVYAEFRAIQEELGDSSRAALEARDAVYERHGATRRSFLRWMEKWKERPLEWEAMQTRLIETLDSLRESSEPARGPAGGPAPRERMRNADQAPRRPAR